MTWLKLSDDFSDQCADLSDAALRTHVEALGWIMRRETGGAISKRDVRRFAETGDPKTAIEELLELGFWQAEGNGYRVVHHMQHQPEPEVIRERRKKDAERQRKKRYKALGLDQGTTMSRRDSPRDDTRDPGRDGTGRDGSGLPQEGEESDSEKASWVAQYAEASRGK